MKNFFICLLTAGLFLFNSTIANSAAMGVVDSNGEEQVYIEATVETYCFLVKASNFEEDDYYLEEFSKIYQKHDLSSDQYYNLHQKYENSEVIQDIILDKFYECIEEPLKKLENITPEQENFINAMNESYCEVMKYNGKSVFSPELEFKIREIFFKYGFNSHSETEIQRIRKKYAFDEVVTISLFMGISECSENEVDPLYQIYSKQAFSDVTLKQKGYSAINYLNSTGVVQGYSDGTFKPENTVNRAEFLKILIKNRNWDISGYGNCFPDVNDQWFAPYVCYATEKGWVQGYVDGTFKPEQTVTKAEALKMLFEINSDKVATPENNSIPYQDISPNDWHTKYIANAKEIGILDPLVQNIYPNALMTRAATCKILYDLMVWMYGEGIEF